MPNGNPAPGPLNSRYFRPVRGKETRARRWDLQFESTSLQQRVHCEPDFLGERSRDDGKFVIKRTERTGARSVDNQCGFNAKSSTGLFLRRRSD